MRIRALVASTLLVPLLLSPILGTGPVALAQTPVATPQAGATTTCDVFPAAGHLLYSTWPELTSDGEVVVVDGAGEITRRLPITGITAGQATAWPDTALVVTAEGELLAINAATGEIVPIDLPPAAVARIVPVPTPGWEPVTSSRYWVFGGPAQEGAYLVDVSTGDATDLAAAITALGGEFTTLQSAVIAPDDAALLLWTGAGLYLLDPADPESLTSLDTGNGLAAPGFFTAAGDLVYSRVIGNRNEVVTRPLAGAGAAETVVDLGPAPAPRRAVLLALPEQDAALITWVVGREENAKPTAIEGIDLATGRSRFILALPESVGYPVIGADGETFVAGGYGPGGVNWQLVSTTTGDRTSLPALTGLLLPGSAYVTSHALFFPLEVMMGREGVPGRVYVALDLATGETHEVLRQRAGYSYSFPLTDPHSQTAVIAVTSPERSALLTIDLASGDVRSIPMETGAVGALLAPGGCWALPVTNRGLVIEPVLVPLGPGEPVPLPSGAGVPVWAPGPAPAGR